MDATNGNGDEAAGRELDVAVAALVAVLDEARAVADDARRSFAARADHLARAGRSLPPRTVTPAVG